MRKIIQRLSVSIILYTVITVLISSVAGAASGIYQDDVNDIYAYETDVLDPTNCYGPLSDFGSFDIDSVSWTNNSNEYSFNITFKEAPSIATYEIMLFFDINDTYSSVSDIPPYDIKYCFFIELNPTDARERITFDYSHQRTVSPVVHDEKTVEVILGESDKDWILSIPNLQPIDEWKVFGYSHIEPNANLDAWDYVNWPNRFSNDRLRCPGFPIWIIVLIVLVALGIAGVIIYILIKKGKIELKRPKQEPKTNS